MRRRLALVATAVTTMVALSFLIPLARLVDQLAEDRALTQAERDAQLVAQFVGVAAASLGTEEAFAALTSAGTTLGGREVTLLRADGAIIGAPLQEGEDLSAAWAGAAVRLTAMGGQVVAVPSVTPTGVGAVVRVFVADSELNAGVARSWLLLGLLGTLLVAIAIAVTDRLGRSMVKPVEDLSVAADLLGRGEVGTRVEPSGPPELHAVGREFNRLAGRIAGLLQRERETAADLSHRLRTPLTAARLTVEAMDGGPQQDRILSDLDEVERTVTHVIRLARRQSEATSRVSDLVAAVRDRYEFWGALADEQHRETQLTLSREPACVALGPSDLLAALDALFGNVFAHTEAGTPYRVAVVVENRTVRLALEDEGPGFSEPGLLERGESTAGSSGLGLDIVRRHVEDAEGTVTIGTVDPHGAVIIIELPITDGPAVAQ